MNRAHGIFIAIEKNIFSMCTTHTVQSRANIRCAVYNSVAQ